MNDKDNKSLFFLLGASVGAITALMLAPFSGRKMRKVTAEKGKEALDKAKKTYNEIDDDNTIKTTVKDLRSRGEKLVSKLKHDSKDKVEKAEELEKKVEDQ